jgi:hypothetical protein
MYNTSTHHMHAHTHTNTNTHTHTHTLSLSLPQSHTHTHTLTLIHTHIHPHHAPVQQALDKQSFHHIHLFNKLRLYIQIIMYTNKLCVHWQVHSTVYAHKCTQRFYTASAKRPDTDNKFVCHDLTSNNFSTCIISLYFCTNIFICIIQYIIASCRTPLNKNVHSSLKQNKRTINLRISPT